MSNDPGEEAQSQWKNRNPTCSGKFQVVPRVPFPFQPVYRHLRHHTFLSSTMLLDEIPAALLPGLY